MRYLLSEEELADERDVVTLRQLGREAAELLGLDRQDQVRLATALSEVGRDVLAGGGSTVLVEVVTEPAPGELLVTMTSRYELAPDGAVDAGGVPAARRLVDSVQVAAGPAGGSVVVLGKRLPVRGGWNRHTLDDVRGALSRPRKATADDELRIQNLELVRTLDELRTRSDELARANEELEETNRGVLAMYNQLSDELEETNTGVVALYAELDERSKQLAAANEAKTRFLRNVSHELRTPVNSILGLASLLAESALDDEQRVQVSYLEGSSRALLAMVNELLDLARAESGRQEVVLADVDLGPLSAELQGTLLPLARPGVALDVQVPPGTTLRTDRDLLARVLRNLLTNALKFTDSGHVRLTAAPDESGEHVVLRVEDTGLGIDAEHVERVFEEFYQVPNRLQPSVKGTGLGLPYARRTVEALGGDLALTSEPGRGSTFVVTLPVGSADGAPVHADQERLQPLLARVLVVDDDDAYRQVLRGLLGELAGSVVEASDGQQALERLRASTPTLVLMDVRMPVLNGDAVLAAMRRDPALEHVPVVLLSSAEPLRTDDLPGAVFVAKRDLARDALLDAAAAAGLSAGQA
ncbi:ATP-binding protein [Cellulomonas sp.]|uniref:ATP-binding response regulator n=1 Tax=Cellulomonas sp. TaxID=40001 RepID=UPI001B05837A|nr:ATP-binding protein [Cellulomonas sp.]MBO9553500.1 response regulator [Cellulomonas sp.]